MVEKNYVVNRAHGRSFFKKMKKGIDLWGLIHGAVKRCARFSKWASMRNGKSRKNLRDQSLRLGKARVSNAA
jgi:hypothetical protein